MTNQHFYQLVIRWNLDSTIPYIYFFNKVLGIIQLTIFFSPAKITIQCMEQNLDITKSRFNEILVI